MTAVVSAGRNNSSLASSAVTVGPWETEADSAAALDETLRQLDLWTVHREVRGTLLQPRAGQQDRGVRIDRVLVPNARLTALGWPHGIIGVEIKKSGMKIGPPIAQALDYSRSVWTLSSGFAIWLNRVFIWPMGPQHGNIASILEQNCIGSAYSTDWETLYLRCGEANVLRAERRGSITIGEASGGRKVGSR